MSAPLAPLLSPPGWRDALAARRAALRAGRAARRRLPEPFPEGDADRGAALLEGHFVLTPAAPAPGRASLWEVAAPTAAFEAERQGFGWLDDLAAVGTGRARALARRWTRAWQGAQGNGRGAGWTLPRAAQRLPRLMAHAAWMADEEVGPTAAELDAAFAVHLRFLQARFACLPGGAAGLSFAARMVAGAAGLDGGHILRERAQGRIEALAAQVIDPAGGVADRCPETLATVFVDLAWAARALEEAGLDPLDGHRAALARAAPTLRALRHGDGHVARFHGGGGGCPARLDAASASARQARAAAPPPAIPMGFVALRRGRTCLVFDAATPPADAAPGQAHASTLAIEVTIGRQPLVVNCGPGAAFGPDWHRAARQTPSHSTLIVDGASSAQFHEDRTAATTMQQAPQTIDTDLTAIAAPAPRVSASHDGYGGRFGLVHARQIAVALDGGGIDGHDTLAAVNPAQRGRFAEACAAAAAAASGGGAGLPFAIRFHLHPDVTAAHDPDRNRVTLALSGGDRWVFAPGDGVTMRLDPGIFLENTRADPVPCRQIVLHGRARHAVTGVRWRLFREDGQPPFRRTAPGAETADP